MKEGWDFWDKVLLLLVPLSVLATLAAVIATHAGHIDGKMDAIVERLDSLPRCECSEPVPGIVMTHGLGGTKDMLLEAYALRYTEAGYGVLTFDYRCFGASDGEPRQLLVIPQQLEDLAAAVAYARESLPTWPYYLPLPGCPPYG